MHITSNYPWRIQNGNFISCEEVPNLEFEGQQIYEVIRLIEGKALFFSEHLHRLEASAKLLNWNIDHFRRDIEADVKVLIEKNGIKNDNIKLVLGEVSGKWPIWTIFGVKGFYPPNEWYETGVKAKLLETERSNPHAKVLNNPLAEQVDKMRAETDYFEALLVNPLGFITEGSRSNVFFIRGNTVISPSSELALKGITREKLLTFMDTEGIDFVEEPITKDELHNFDACFITGTSIDLLPLLCIEETVYDSGKNSLMQRLLEGYRQAMKASLNGF